MSITYEDPQTGSTGAKPAQLEGHDVVVVTHTTKVLTTVHGESAAAVVTIWDATDEEVYYESLLFSKVLVATCARSIGKPIVGTVTKGKSSKPGMSAPWVFAPIEDDERKGKAIAFAESNGIQDELAAVALNSADTSSDTSAPAAKPSAAKNQPKVIPVTEDDLEGEPPF